MAARDPEASLVAVFKNMAIPNPAKTAEAGRPIFDDREVVEIRAPGSRNGSAFHPANVVSHWQDDPETGEQTPDHLYAERFRHQYQQFKAHGVQTKTGTPLTHAAVPDRGPPRRSCARRTSTRSRPWPIIDGEPLKNLGYGGAARHEEPGDGVHCGSLKGRRRQQDGGRARGHQGPQRAARRKDVKLLEVARQGRCQRGYVRGHDDRSSCVITSPPTTGRGPVGQPSSRVRWCGWRVRRCLIGWPDRDTAQCG